MIFRLIMSVLGEASAGMRWAGTLAGVSSPGRV